MKDPCENCGKCCLDTEMILSENDINSIINSQKGLKKADFAQKNDEGFFQLINIDGHCYFFELDSKTCKIYDNRPKGCQFYPLIFDLDENDCRFDETCPKPSLLYQDKGDLKRICIEIKKFIKEDLEIDI